MVITVLFCVCGLCPVVAGIGKRNIYITLIDYLSKKNI